MGFPVWVQLLLGTSGLFWAAAYALIIRRASLDKVTAMPLASLATNISWEFITTFVYPHEFPLVLVNFVWLALDVVILWQCARFGRTELAEGFRRYYLLGVFALLVLGGTWEWAIFVHFRDGGAMGAYTSNALMSTLYVAMLLRRNSLAGQSFAIALLKLVGTLLVTVGFAVVLPSHPLLIWCMAVTTAMDVVYLVAIAIRYRAERLSVLTRL